MNNGWTMSTLNDDRMIGGEIKIFPLLTNVVDRYHPFQGPVENVDIHNIKQVLPGETLLCLDDILNEFRTNNQRVWAYYKFLFYDKVYLMEEWCAKTHLNEMK